MRKDAEAACFGVKWGRWFSGEQMPWNGDNPGSDSLTLSCSAGVGAMKWCLQMPPNLHFPFPYLWVPLESWVSQNRCPNCEVGAVCLSQFPASIPESPTCSWLPGCSSSHTTFLWVESRLCGQTVGAPISPLPLIQLCAYEEVSPPLWASISLWVKDEKSDPTQIAYGAQHKLNVYLDRYLPLPATPCLERSHGGSWPRLPQSTSKSFFLCLGHPWIPAKGAANASRQRRSFLAACENNPVINSHWWSPSSNQVTRICGAGPGYQCILHFLMGC